ncbi:hypothetical protein EAS64_10620 [Trebonia kvetii]|uniref:Uncharacterized protein n=1 Tax=Trebonia kvetii TaxID=2480626 RepID=A0A6P2C3L7_9ACTN|nr:hypothetical protein [Trebonia kvetii]TVZ05066.1 hypothetical protein EAS64_10620 [Trebonia kvetii]
MGQRADSVEPARSPFPVAPADVPAAAVSAVKRTLLRNEHRVIEDPMDDELARLVVAVVIAALRDYDGQGGHARSPSAARGVAEAAGRPAASRGPRRAAYGELG